MQNIFTRRKAAIKFGIVSLFTFLAIAGGLYFFTSVSPKKDSITAQFLKLPLNFERNDGQVDQRVKYLTKGQGYSFYFTPKEIMIVLDKRALKMQFVGASLNPVLEGKEVVSSKSNYFIGNDPQQWYTNIPHFAKITYQGLYQGINAVFYGNGEQFEYDLCLAPGANPEDARFQIEGADKLYTDGEGNLHIVVQEGQELLMQKPFVYQMVKEEKIAISGEFVLLAQNEVGFSVGSYDSSQSLVIDPVLEYSTYLGGTGSDIGGSIEVDASGNAYVTGRTTSSDFPTTAGAFQPNLASGATQNIFVTKLNSTGSALVYSTYLGGSGSETDGGN